MNGRKSILMILFFLFLGSSALDARRAKRPPSAEKIWNDALKANDDTGYKTTYKRKRYKSKRRRYKKHRKSKKKSAAPKIISLSSEKKLQKSLVILGFYQGTINGEVNEPETRQAIKAMNHSYRNEDTTFLDAEAKDILINLADLSQYDSYLTSTKTDENSKNIKLQTALKVFGFYQDEIDGLVGPGTHSSIVQYKEKNNLTQGKKLDFEEKYQLIAKAIVLNREHIKIAKEKLKLPENLEEKPLVTDQGNQTKPVNSKTEEDKLVVDQVEHTTSAMVEDFFTEVAAEEEVEEEASEEAAEAAEEVEAVEEEASEAVEAVEEEEAAAEEEETSVETVKEEAADANTTHKELEDSSVTQDEVEDFALTPEECSTLVDSYDEAVLGGDMDKFGDLESTANILINMCDIQKTKTGNIAETMKRLKEGE